MQSWTHLPSKDIVTLTHSLLKRSEIHIPVTLGVYQRVAVIVSALWIVCAYVHPLVY